MSVSVSNGKNQDGAWKPSDFYQCTLNDKLGAKISQWLTKGTKVYVSGTPSCKAYLSKDNAPQASISISVGSIELLGIKEYKQEQNNQVNAKDVNAIPF